MNPTKNDILSGLIATTNTIYDILTNGDEKEIQDLKDAAAIKQELTFSINWKINGYPIIKVGEKFAASSMATNVSKNLSLELRPPFPSFLVDLPKDILFFKTTENETFSADYLGVSTEPSQNSQTLLWTVRMMSAMSFSRGKDIGMVNCQIDKYISDPINYVKTDIFTYGQPDKTLTKQQTENNKPFELASRLIASAVCAMTNAAMVEKVNKKVHEDYKKNPKKATSSKDPSPRVFKIIAPVKVDITKEIREYQLTGCKGKQVTVRTIVCGHWHRQAHGPKASLRRWQWVQPYSRGPEDAPLAIRPHILVDKP